MVASAKLHKAQKTLEKMLPYEKRLRDILLDLLSVENKGGIKCFSSTNGDVSKVALLCVSSDSSLCGAFNSSVAKKTVETIEEYRKAGVKDIVVYSVGRKIREALKGKDFISLEDRTSLCSKRNYSEASALAKELTEAFKNRGFDRIELIYSHFKSIATQSIVREVFLPFDELSFSRKESKNAKDPSVPYILEPDIEGLMSRLIPEYLNMKLYSVLSDAAAAEHAARTVAMQTATDNGEDLLQELTLEYNKGRQEKITDELLDMIGGSIK